MRQLTTMDLRDLNGYRKGEREGNTRGEDDSEMKDDVFDEHKWSWKNLLRWPCHRCIQCLAPVVALWLVVQDERYLFKVGGWLLLAGMLWAGLNLGVSLIRFPFQYRRHNKKKFSEKSEVAGKRTDQPNQECIISQHGTGHLLSIVRALLDGLVIFLLQEPVSGPNVSQIQGLLTKLESVSQIITEAVSNSLLMEEQLLQANDKEVEVIKIRVEDRVKQMCAYLQERINALCILLQTQDQYGVCIANIQQELQDYWELLEDLHTKVTLQPEKGSEDPHTVLIDTEGLYTKLGLFQRRIHECQVHLSKSTHLLEELDDRQQDLAQTMGLTLVSTWTKDLLQCNTHQFKKVFKDFTSLVQQTLTFVMHLQDLSVSQEKNSIKISDVEDVQSSVSPLASLPVYSIALMTENTALDLEPKPPNTPSSKFSMINLLCGVRKRR